MFATATRPRRCVAGWAGQQGLGCLASDFGVVGLQAMAQIKFPKELDVKVDVKSLRLKKAGWAVIKEWIAKRVTQILNGLEEEVLIGFIFNLLESDEKLCLDLCAAAPVVASRCTTVHAAPRSWAPRLLQAVNAKEMHVSLVPFLEKNTSLFMKELWSMLASAATNDSGVPQQLLDAKVAELEARRLAEGAIRMRIEEQRAVQAAAMQAQQAMQGPLPGPPPLGALPGPPPTGSGPGSGQGGGSRSSRWDEHQQRPPPVKKEAAGNGAGPGPVRAVKEEEPRERSSRDDSRRGSSPRRHHSKSSARRSRSRSRSTSTGSSERSRSRSRDRRRRRSSRERRRSRSRSREDRRGSSSSRSPSREKRKARKDKKKRKKSKSSAHKSRRTSRHEKDVAVPERAAEAAAGSESEGSQGANNPAEEEEDDELKALKEKALSVAARHKAQQAGVSEAG
ncbi:hypothetical protein QJQ45_026009 [Haematococcus lacustris]|nr:hypothetical protein QJQ45_026009 [Haematococcus lacustris]